MHILKKLLPVLLVTVIFTLQAAAQEELKKYPGDALGYFYSATYYDGKGNYDKALILYDLSIKENQNFVDPRFFKAQLFLRQEKLFSALKEYEDIKAMPQQDIITAELAEFNVDSEIAKLKQKIQEKLKAENPQPKKKKFWEKILAVKIGGKKKGAQEAPRGELIFKKQTVLTAVAAYVSDTKVKIYKGEKDGLKIGDELVLVEKNHKVGKAKLTEVKLFYSSGELLEFEPSKEYKEGDKLAGGYFIFTPPAEQNTP